MEVFLWKRWLSYQNDHLKQVGITSTYLNLQTNLNSQTDSFTQTSAKTRNVDSIDVEFKIFPKGKKENEISILKSYVTFLVTQIL